MGDLSAHFSLAEFADSRTGAVGADLSHLVEHLELLRSICLDRPLRIVSGWRSAATNLAVGGATRSQHLYGRAADLEPGYANEDQAEKAGFIGIGLDGGWAVHVDVRPGSAARWHY